MRILQAVNHVESTILSARHSVSTSGASRERMQRSNTLAQHTPSHYCMDGRQLVKRIKLALVFAKDDGKRGQILGEATLPSRCFTLKSIK